MTQGCFELIEVAPNFYSTVFDQNATYHGYLKQLLSMLIPKEMIAHRFLSEDMRVQETESEGGIRVQANFAENTGRILYPDGTVVLVDDWD